MLQNSATKNKNTDGHSFRHFFPREHFLGGRGFPRGPNHCPQSGKKRKKGRNRQFGGFGHFTIKIGRNPPRNRNRPRETVAKPSNGRKCHIFACVKPVGPHERFLGAHRCWNTPWGHLRWPFCAYEMCLQLCIWLFDGQRAAWCCCGHCLSQTMAADTDIAAKRGSLRCGGRQKNIHT